MVEISLLTLIELHQLAMEETGALPEPVRDWGALESALARAPSLSAYGVQDPLQLITAVVCGLIQNHPFGNGNKRTAWQALTWLLGESGYRLDPTLRAAECAGMIIGLADHQLSESEFLSWLRHHASS
ncbi:MAG: type II toxin-antitoxin system death-on-curing family toxin [Sulfobacillus sp.]